ncbi:MAG: 3'-5' exonuclease [Dorea sp.]
MSGWNTPGKDPAAKYEILASKEEIGAYEEERRLFYVGVTRAKNQLNIVATGKPSRFCNELLEKNISAESYQKLSDELGEGVIVKHRKFGKGVVTEIEGEHIRIPLRR